MKTKIVNRDKALIIRKKLARQGKKVVFTNGCFDLLHAGHASYLDKARHLGDFLIIGLNSDSSVCRLKGPGRPIMPYSDRALLLSYLIPVDLVVAFGEDTPEKLINFIRPDILVKGADYKKSEIVGAREVQSWGGVVKRIPLVKGKSSSNLIALLETAVK
jgi:D-beta-D-heptose 7-phosphate kinase/D-beta-D-heptose 1-phosphate adenosyltransferase